MTHITKPEATWAEELADSINQARKKVKFCRECGFYCEDSELCEVCQDSTRDHSTLCVVQTPHDVLTFERAGIYRGLYHCLGGKISPLDGVSAEDLNIPKLIERASKHTIKEVILALGFDVEGETTCLYLIRQLSPLGKEITRLARGLAVGSGLDAADPVTLAHALTERRKP